MRIAALAALAAVSLSACAGHHHMMMAGQAYVPATPSGLAAPGAVPRPGPGRAAPSR